jgi:hypothetical protein
MPLSPEQITCVRNRIQREGIHGAELLDDMVDHICCAIEREMDRGSGFESAFSRVFSEFSPAGGLGELQAEIDYLFNYKMYVMKKITLILACAVTMFFFLSTLINGIGLLQQYEWSFMPYLAMINQYAIGLFVLPAYWLHQYRIAAGDPTDGLTPALKRIMYLLGFLCSEALVHAVFLKLAHMPGGNQLFIISAILGMAYMPLYLYRKYQLIGY